MSASTTPTSDPSPVQAILSGAETGGFSGSGRVERHAIARGDGGRVRAARLVIDVGSPVPDELPGQGFALGLSPLPRRDGVRLRPQAAFRISRRCFEFGERTDIRSILPVPPSRGPPAPALFRCSVPELVMVYRPPLSAGWPSSCNLPDIALATAHTGGAAWNTSIAH